jgi:hypothetical protein
MGPNMTWVTICDPSEKGVRLAQKMQFGPRIPVGKQLERLKLARLLGQLGVLLIPVWYPAAGNARGAAAWRRRPRRGRRVGGLHRGVSGAHWAHWVHWAPQTFYRRCPTLAAAHVAFITVTSYCTSWSSPPTVINKGRCCTSR